MRVQIAHEELSTFLSEVKAKLGKSWQEIATDICGVTPRTFNDWRRNKYTIPMTALYKLHDATGIRLPQISSKLDDYWYITKSSSRLGAQRRYELYGNLGTPEGRRLGGLKSIKKNRLLGHPPFLPRDIFLPPKSPQLAEFIGIVLGDGGITPYQVKITLNRYDDKAYSQYVVKLCTNLFALQPTSYLRQSVCTIVVARTHLVQFLAKMGLKIGNKVRNQISVPGWISANSVYSKACLRGLVDTDGSFYVDRHKYKNKVYLNGGLNFTNRSLPLLNFFKERLEEFGFHPTQRTPYSIFLRREEEIARYFKEVGSSNPKHLNKYTQYLNNRSGEVPKWS